MTTTATQFLLRHSRAIIVIIAMMALAACGESATAPGQSSIDRVAAARVVPAVTDARVRITLGVENSVVRDRLRHDLSELESALTNGDGDKARFHLRVIETVTSDYRAQQSPTTTDGAEISAIELMMIAVRKEIRSAP
ncbi:MAG: hypothetical protein ACREOK_02875 [Gemmatimonadaceae bacterium]